MILFGPPAASPAPTPAAQPQTAGAAPSFAAPAPPPPAWGQLAQAPQPVAAALPPPVGVGIPITIEFADGTKVKPLLFFGPECASPAVVRPLIEALKAMGVPVDAWRPKNDRDGGRRGGW